MKWSAPRLPNIRNISDRFHIYDRVVNNNREIITGSGSPVTSWNNMAITSTGRISTTLTRCYCWDAQKGQPDRKHFLCGGTGMLGGWQKYGYQEEVFSTTNTYTTSTGTIVVTGTRNSTLALSGSGLVGAIITPRYTLTDFIEVNHFLANDEYDSTIQKVEYYYSTNDSTWTAITISNYTATLIANRSGSLSIPEGTQYIRFKIVLRKRNATVASPKFNSIRFRYRNMKTLYEIDPRFNVTIPSFLASREPQTQQIAQGQFGWSSEFPLRWWVLPDARIENNDVVMFLQGEYINMRFETSNVIRYTYGPYTQVTHRGFESRFVRDSSDLFGIIHYLI